MKHRGSCLCGGIQYEINGALTDVLNCHCAMCRKLHASAFRTRAKVQAADWTTLKGTELLRFYESSPGEHKGFCPLHVAVLCGTSSVVSATVTATTAAGGGLDVPVAARLPRPRHAGAVAPPPSSLRASSDIHAPRWQRPSLERRSRSAYR